jgi:hypothetical protein
MIGPFKTEDEFAEKFAVMARRVWKVAEEFGCNALLRATYEGTVLVCGTEDPEKGEDEEAEDA